MSEFSLRQLEVFLAVVETGSFTEAGKELFLAQSTISGHIKELEASLNVTLFQRNYKRNLILTKAGRTVYMDAKKIVAGCETLREKMSTDKDRELVIGASTVPSHHLLPRLLTDFRTGHPGCIFHLHFGDSKDILQQLLDNDIQLAFVGSKTHTQQLEYKTVTEDRLVLITPVAEPYLSAHKKGLVGTSFVESGPLIVREDGSGTQRRVEEYLDDIGQGKTDHHIVAYMDNSALILKSVSCGLGISLISNLLAEKEAAAGRLLLFELDGAPVSREIYMVRPKKQSSSALAEAFWAMLPSSKGSENHR